jgi:raffinose/stachyose/melibiose transport system permease protein
MIPSLSILVGVYSVLVKIKGISTLWGLILVTAAFGIPMTVYLYTNFITSIPEALDEAAAIDGCSVLQTYFLIILPQLKPVTVSVIILNGVSVWNEYAYSLYVLQSPKTYTLTLMISQYFSTGGKDFNGAAAAATLAILPITILYLCLQKYFIQGQLDSAVKG